jgi:glycosyltransferase involved in cell wall biosynthesis
MVATPERLRVAMLGQFPPDPNRVAGGVEAAVGVLCAEMARRPDVELHVLCSSPAVSHRRDESRDALTVHWLPRRRWGRVTFYRRDTGDLRRVIRELRPDVVHAHGSGHYAAAAVAARLPATVITAHGIVFREAKFATNARERLGWWMQARWERRILHGARHLIAISPYVERELRGRTTAAFHAIENPVSDAFFSIPPPGLRARILWAGRLIPRKDPRTALRAFARVRSVCPAAELHIAGEQSSDPGCARETRAQAAAQRLGDSVHFLGELDQDAMLNQYRGCQFVMLSSIQETAPVVIAQAMAAGRPVVTTAAGGCGGMVEDGATGVVVEVGDDVALAGAMTRLIEDRELSAKMSAAARRKAWARFRPSAVVDRTLELYRSLVAEGN